ncbi:hypothetical protein PPMP20_01445 [Paraburkholderia phymatum]|uniref:Uncharacterized protein n=1 Tax=Paraburkholderia phymatum (strain DSM 17167 / CIP 108236 / LMG 21445 / STM815) TaxID=391038 RepID=B2JVZ6_PARP8|nr:hypothetical protein [Paraburkholderia phymatum]ACC75123.1 hypothetical protein Bphy_6061 [Paraburkholderia phymatum STM815]
MEYTNQGHLDDAVVLAPAEDSPENVIVFAWKTPSACLLSPDESLARTRLLETMHALNLCKTAIKIEDSNSIDWDERATCAGT